MCFVLGCVCWLGSFDVMCLAVPKGSWLVRSWPDTLVGVGVGGDLALEFAGLGLAVCCVEARFGVVGAPGSQGVPIARCVRQQLVGALLRDWCVFETTLGGAGQTFVKEPRGLGGIGCWVCSRFAVFSGLLFLRFSSLAFYLLSVLGRSPCGHVFGVGSTVGFVQFPMQVCAGWCSSSKCLCHLVWFQCKAFGWLAIGSWRSSLVAHLFERGHQSKGAVLLSPPRH